MHDQYFEGTLQLRNPDNEVKEYVENQIDKAKNVFISKIVKHKNGLDYYVSSRKFLHQLAKKLLVAFGGELKESPRLFSRNRQTGKEVFRLNVLFKLYDFKKGDIINIDKKIVKVTNISKSISSINIKTGKKTTFNIKNKDYEILDRKNTIVTKIKPVIEIMDPETYQNVVVDNKAKVKHGEKVKVVICDGTWIV